MSQIDQDLEQLPDEKNPASCKYKRVLDYPHFNKMKICFNIAFFVVVIVAATLLSCFLLKNIYLKIFIPIGCAVLYILLNLSSIMIFCVQCYQLLAPTELRMKCRFEPSCSQYMILAIKKYGAIRGFIKGVKRLKRCRPPNGGFDEP